MNSQEDFTIGLTRSQKFTLGLFLLLLVDIIWVGSSELTKVYQFKDFKPKFSDAELLVLIEVWI